MENMKATTIWISEEELAAAKQVAKGEDMSLSQLVRKLLRTFNNNPTDD